MAPLLPFVESSHRQVALTTPCASGFLFLLLSISFQAAMSSFAGSALSDTLTGLNYVSYSAVPASAVAVNGASMPIGGGYLLNGAARKFDMPSPLFEAARAAHTLGADTVSISLEDVDASIERNHLRLDADIKFTGVPTGTEPWFPYNAKFTVSADLEMSSTYTAAEVLHLTIFSSLIGTAASAPVDIRHISTDVTALGGSFGARVSWAVEINSTLPWNAPSVHCPTGWVWQGQWRSHARSCAGVLHNVPMPSNQATNLAGNAAGSDIWASSTQTSRLTLHLDLAPWMAFMGILQLATADHASASSTKIRLKEVALVNHEGATAAANAVRAVTTTSAVAQDITMDGAHHTMKLAVGNSFSCASLVGGGVSCWGNNGHGQLGQGNLKTLSLPKDAATLTFSTPVVRLSVGDQVSVDGDLPSVCVILTNSDMFCWGRSHLQDATYGDDDSHVAGGPVAISSSLPWQDVAVGDGFMCASTSTGAIRCGKKNGLAARIGHEYPGFEYWINLSLVIAVFVHSEVACALRLNGNMHCWGYNGYGQLGISGNFANTAFPSTNVPSNTAWVNFGTRKAVDIQVGLYHVCATASLSGETYCWGAVTRSAQGSGTVSFAATMNIGTALVTDLTAQPDRIVDTALDACVSLGVGVHHSCCATGTGRLYCWGSSRFITTSTVETGYPRRQDGFLGLGHRQIESGGAHGARFAGPVVVATGVTKVATFAYHSCALLINGGITCFGRNFENQLGLSPDSGSSVGILEQPIDLGLLDSQVRLPPVASVDESHSLTFLTHRPHDVAPPRAIATSSYRSCVLDANSNVRCFGSNDFGGLGGGKATELPTAEGEPFWLQPTLEFSGPVKSFSLGMDFACAIIEGSNRAECWGMKVAEINGLFDRVGGVLPLTFYTDPSLRPNMPRSPKSAGVVTQPASATVVSLSAGSTHVCFALSDGKVICTGLNENGQTGTGSRLDYRAYNGPPSTTLAALGLPAGTYFDVAASEGHSCAASSSGVICWGANDAGELGAGAGDVGNKHSTASSRTVQTLSGIVSIEAGVDHTCVLTTVPSIRCWGLGSGGQLGTGSTANVVSAGSSTAVTLPADPLTLTTGDVHSCALLVDGRVACWGGNTKGQLGLGHRNVIGDDEGPAIVPLGGKAIAVAAGGFTTCAIIELRGVLCWGLNHQRSLGYGTARSAGSESTAATVGALSSLSVFLPRGVYASMPFDVSFLGARHELLDIHQFGAGVDDLSTVESVPSWFADLVGASSHASFPVMPAQQGAACLGASRALTSSSLRPQVTDRQWEQLCTWPDTWASGSKLTTSTIQDACNGCATLNAPRPAATGGLVLAMNGDFWTLFIFSSAIAAPTVTIGGETCEIIPGGGRTDKILCEAPAIPAGTADSTALSAQLVHAVPFVSSPITWASTVHYAGPVLGTVRAADGSAAVAQAGGDSVELRGSNLFNAEDPVVPGAQTLTTVSVFADAAGTVAAGTCSLTRVSSTLLLCNMPAGVNSAYLRVSVAGQTSDLKQVLYERPQVGTVAPATVLRAAVAGATVTASFLFTAAASQAFARSGNLALPGDLSGSVAGAACATMSMPSTTTVQCNGVVTNNIDGTTDAITLFIDGIEANTAATRIRVFGEPSADGVSPLVVSGAGQTVEVFGAEFGADASGLTAGDIVAVTFNSIACTDVKVFLNRLTCDLPAGVGSLSPVRVTRVGGYVAELTSADLKYAAASVQRVDPVYALQAPAGGSAVLVDFYVHGTGYASGPGSLVSDALLSGSVAGAPCGSLTMLNVSTVVCRDVDLRAVGSGGADGVTLVIDGSASFVPSGVRVRVYGEPEVFSVSPLPVSTAGERVTVSGTELGRSTASPGVLSSGVGPSGDIVSVTFGAGNVACTGVVVSGNSIQCDAPAGVGSLSPVRVTRVGGYVAELTSADLKYDSAEVTSVSPDYIIRSPADSVGYLTDFVFTGSGFSLPATTVPDAQLSGSVAGAPCASLTQLGDTTIRCAGVNASLVAPSNDGIQLTITGAAARSSAIRLRVYGEPALFSVQPLPVSPNGSSVTIVGVEFGRSSTDPTAIADGITAAGDIISVTLGPAACSGVTVVGGEITCAVPAGVGTLSPVRVTRRGGWVATFTDASVAYAPATVTSISPDFILRVPSSGPAALRNFTIVGTGFVASGTTLPSSALVASVAGVACPAVHMLDSNTLLCTNLDMRSVTGSDSSVSVAISGISARASALRVRVYGEPVIFSAAPLPFPVVGGELQLIGSDLGRDPTDGSAASAGLGAAGDITSVTLANGSIPCTSVVVSGNEIRCQIPAGVGSLSPIHVARAGGFVASLSGQALRYASAQLTSVSPAYELKSVMQRFVSFTLSGSSLAVPSDLPSGSDISATVAGAPCGSLSMPDSNTVLCSQLDASQLNPADDSVQLVIRGGQVETAAVRIVIQDVPEISALQPPVLSAAGGVAVTILGSNLGGSASDIVNVTVGSVLCANPRNLTRSRIICTAPSLSAAGGSPADVSVALRSGSVVTLPAGLTFTEPEVFDVQGGQLIAYSQSSAASRATVIVRGLVLGNAALLGGGARRSLSSQATKVSIAGQDCATDLDGVVTISSNVRTVHCSNFDQALLNEPAGDGAVNSAAVVLTTNEGLQAASQVGAVRIMGSPLVSRINPVRATTGAAMTVSGANFGWARSDVAAVMVGSITVPDANWLFVSSNSLQITSLPAPASEDPANVVGVAVSVQLKSGRSAVSSNEQRLAYILPPKPPATAPQAVCAYRDGSGFAHVTFAWLADTVTVVHPVKAWVFDLVTDPEDSWFVAGADGVVDIDTRRVSVASNDVSEITDASAGPTDPIALCLAARRSIPAARWYDVRLLGVTATPKWARVRAATELNSAVLDGPSSEVAGPLFEFCGGTSNGQQRYLATQFASPGTWSQAVCQACPVGAVCDGRAFESISNQPGFYRADWDASGLTFVACINEGSCPSRSVKLVNVTSLGYLRRPGDRVLTGGIPGAYAVGLPNAVANQTVSLAQNPSGQQAAFNSIGDKCAPGFEGRLCAQCQAGFSRTGLRECGECAPVHIVWLSLLGGTLLGGIMLGYLTYTTIALRGQASKPYVSLNKMLFTHLQQIAIASAFPFTWPAILLRMFAVFDASSSISDSLVSVDCLEWDGSAFRAATFTQLLLPLFVGTFLATLWICIGVARFFSPEQAAEMEMPISPANAASSKPRAIEAPSPTAAKARLVVDTGGSEEFGSVASFVDDSSPHDERRLASADSPDVSGDTPTAASMVSYGHDAVVEVSVKRQMFDTTKVQLQRTPVIRGLVISLVVMGFVLHLGLAKSALALMTCENVDGQRFLVGDYNINCGSPENQRWMYGIGIPALLVYGFGIPMASGAILWKHRHNLHEPITRATYGFLYLTFRPKYFFWSVVIMVRKVMLAFISVLLAPAGLGLQTTLASSLLVLSLLVQDKLSPFKTKLLNALESASIAVSAITLAGGATIVDVNVSEGAKDFVTATLVIINGGYVAMMVYLLVYHFALEVRTVSKEAMKRMRKLGASMRTPTNMPTLNDAERRQPTSGVAASGAPPMQVSVASSSAASDLPAAIPEVDEEPSSSSVGERVGVSPQPLSKDAAATSPAGGEKFDPKWGSQAASSSISLSNNPSATPKETSGAAASRAALDDTSGESQVEDAP